MPRDSYENRASESLEMSALCIGLGLALAGAVYQIHANYANSGALRTQVDAAATPNDRAWTADLTKWHTWTLRNSAHTGTRGSARESPPLA